MENGSILATSELATSQEHWLIFLCALATLGLIFATIYLTLRSLLTIPKKIAVPPHHIRRAPSILRWIAVFGPLLAIFAGIFELYLGIVRAGWAVEITIVTTYILLSQFLFWLLIGLIVALLALLGVGLIFLRHLQ